MRLQYDPDFLKKLKKADVIIRKSFKERITIFKKDPDDPLLNNHILRKPYESLRSIDITSDWRAIYEEIHEEDEEIVYFIMLGTHDELYSI